LCHKFSRRGANDALLFSMKWFCQGIFLKKKTFYFPTFFKLKRRYQQTYENIQCISWRTPQQAIFRKQLEIKKHLSIEGVNCADTDFGGTESIWKVGALSTWWYNSTLKLTTSKKFRSDWLLVQKTLQVKILETSSNIYHM